MAEAKLGQTACGNELWKGLRRDLRKNSLRNGKVSLKVCFRLKWARKNYLFLSRDPIFINWIDPTVLSATIVKVWGISMLFWNKNAKSWECRSKPCFSNIKKTKYFKTWTVLYLHCIALKNSIVLIFWVNYCKFSIILKKIYLAPTEVSRCVSGWERIKASLWFYQESRLNLIADGMLGDGTVETRF